MAIFYDASKGDFGIEASLGPGSPDAAETFDSIAALIRAFEQIDRDFASLFHPGLEVELG